MQNLPTTLKISKYDYAYNPLGWSTIFSLLASLKRVLFLLTPSPYYKAYFKKLIFACMHACTISQEYK